MTPTPLESRRLWIMIQYNGPFGHICDYLWRLDIPRDEDAKAIDPRQDVEDGSIRDRLACFAESLDRRWRNHYAKDFRDPPKRWKRRP